MTLVSLNALQALQEAFEIFCNKKLAGSSSAELLATLCNNILKKAGTKKLSDEAIEATLQNVVQFLVYSSEKDLFAEFYQYISASNICFFS